MIHIEKKEYLLELRSLLDSMREEDREAVLNMASSCFDAADSDEEAIVRLGRPMAAARRLLKSYEPGCYAEMFEDEAEEEAKACELISEEAKETPEEIEKAEVERIFAEVFGLGKYKNKDEASKEPLGEGGREPKAALEDVENFHETDESEDPKLSEEAEKKTDTLPLKEESREETARIEAAVEERASSEDRANKAEKKISSEEKPQYSAFKIIGYSIPAIVFGIPISIILVLLSLLFLLVGVAVAAVGVLFISFVFLSMSALSDILMTAGAGLAVTALGALIIMFAVYFFVKFVIGFINRVLEGGAKNCLKDKSKYRAPIVEEDSLGQKITKTVSAVLLSILGLGILSFLFSMILGADIKRIAAVIFAKYDLAAVIRYLIATFGGLKSFIFR